MNNNSLEKMVYSTFNEEIRGRIVAGDFRFDDIVLTRIYKDYSEDIWNTIRAAAEKRNKTVLSYIDNPDIEDEWLFERYMAKEAIRLVCAEEK